MTEAQKTSDRLYEFFYNRYYYNEVKGMISMPSFLTIHSDEYKDLASHVRKRDKELLMLVKKSKFESNHGRSYSCAAKTSRTEEEESLSQTMKSENNSFSSVGMSFLEMQPEVQVDQKNVEYARKRYRSMTKH